MPTDLSPAMPVAHVTMHPRGLHPLEAARAYHLHEEEGLSQDSVCDEVRDMEGNRPSKKAVWTAVRQVKALEGNVVPQGNYDNCGRKRMLTAEDEAAIVEFAKKWQALLHLQVHRAGPEAEGGQDDDQPGAEPA